MRFLAIYTPNATTSSAPPSKECMEDMQKLIEESTKAGTLLATGGLLPISKGGARVSYSAGKITVKDGPFTEAKEVIAGFALLQAKSRDEAIESCKRFLKIAGDGENELFQIMDHPGECPQL